MPVQKKSGNLLKAPHNSSCDCVLDEMASQQTLKMPPILVDESNYGEWKNDLEIWESFTDLDVEKEEVAVYLSLIGQACDCVRILSHQQTSTENGIKNILESLDSLFLKDKNICVTCI